MTRWLTWIAIVLLFACHKPCPAKPAPPPVTAIWTAPSCNLPAIPRAPVWGGIPEEVGGVQTGRTIVAQDGLAELGGYLVAVRDWIADASACLQAKP